MSVVVINELAEDRFELGAMEDQHPVEALPADGPDEPRGGRVRTRGPDRRGDVPDALRGEHLVEAGGELGISVPDQELRLATLLGQVEAQIKSLLGDPLHHRVGGGADNARRLGAREPRFGRRQPCPDRSRRTIDPYWSELKGLWP